VRLLSGARARGIELEPAYCEYARRSAAGLNVSGVEFIQADAREAPFADGTVFFLYTPFRGALLQRVLERLRTIATERSIRVCTYGPCTAEIERETWLRLADGTPRGEHEVAVFHAEDADTV
jgi:ubiquinone/menaquinone biosynthesis C-methylase UbiE